MSPTQAFGVYPAEGTAGDEVSSTYEGRHVTLTAAELLTSAGSGVATKGLPCVFGIIAGNVGVGVCFKTGTTTDLIPIDTEGIWDLSVVANNDAGGSLVTGGDSIYINTTTGVLSKISNAATQILFGYALGQVAAAATAVIAVKVHFDPSMDNARQTYRTVASGAYSYGKQFTGILAAGESTGLALYANAVPGGIQTGGIYGGGLWVEPAADFVDNGGLLVAWDIGFWAGAAGEDITSSRVIALQMMVDLAANPGSIAWFRVNVAASSGTMNTIFEAANPASLAYSAGTAGTGVVGTIPFADIVGVGVVYIDVHAAVT